MAARAKPKATDDGMTIVPANEASWAASCMSAAAASSPPPGFTEINRPTPRRAVMRIDF